MTLNEKLNSYEKQFTPKYPKEFEELNFENIPFLTIKQIRTQGFNQKISHENLMKLPKHLRRFWYVIDLRYLDYEPPKFPEKDPISKMTETPPDLEQLINDKNKRMKIKSIVLGELDNDEIDKMKNSF